jgi:hypothetical protein
MRIPSSMVMRPVPVPKLYSGHNRLIRQTSRSFLTNQTNVKRKFNQWVWLMEMTATAVS